MDINPGQTELVVPDGETLVSPALAAINDPRFAGGVRAEFEQARAELRQGTATSRKQQSMKLAVPSRVSMKVVLDQRQLAYDPRETGKPLFDHLCAAGLSERYMEPLIFAVLTPRNKTAGHGGGAAVHDPGETEATSIVAAAAGAIAYLHTKMP